ncbi:ornithine cyclodeaminase [Caulobacter endophyticus]|uniref:Ornithine cyclodeaminase n=1 Tax=Caulobacter endophyticus TaxID=2172652 RepID=A0A2T9JGW9_9CAUL|nr:ornithine cyclodeaminase [Caulobacter endophyticus]PVM82919.1 ornithine cyclodeaminase [Caulobacter endophyticus]
MLFVDVAAVVKLVEQIGIETVLAEMAGYIEEDFRRWEDFEKSPRLASHSDHGVIELMPTSDGREFTFKYVNGHPGNTADGLQTVVGFGVLANVRTGYPEMIAEMTLTTALRTAATSAMAARHLARDDAETMAIIGLGAQSEFQAHAFRAVLGVRRLRVFDIDPAATRKFMANMRGRGFDIVAAASAAEAVLGADIVTTVTADRARNHILSDNMVGAGVHLNAVGGDCPGKTELQSDILRRGEVFVEFTPQTRIEGEIQQLEPDFPVTELWQVVSGQAPGRRGAGQITVFDSVGFAIEDFSALRYLRDRIAVVGGATRLDMLAAPADPRDLFGLVGAEPAVERALAS